MSEREKWPKAMILCQEQEDFAASKLKSAVHAFLDKNGKVGVPCSFVLIWSFISSNFYHLD